MANSCSGILDRDDSHPSREEILASAKAVFHWTQTNIIYAGSSDDGSLVFGNYSCGWERSTYTLGLATYYSATEDDDAASYLQAWGEGHDYKLCQFGDGLMPGVPMPGVSAASLCGDALCQGP